jgi:hypothetical protein
LSSDIFVFVICHYNLQPETQKKDKKNICRSVILW